MKVRVKKLEKEAVVPTFGSDMAAGADLYACINKPVDIMPGETVFVSTGLAMEIPEGYAGLIFARSGLSCKKGLAPANKVGVVDADYRGEVKVALHNHGKESYRLQPQERIAQMMITAVPTVQYLEVDELSDTDRGEGGFGSTGRK